MLITDLITIKVWRCICEGLTTSDFDDLILLANKVTVMSFAHLGSLLYNGYELSKINWRSIDGSDLLSVVPTLLLEKGNDKLLANAGKISDHVIQLQPLYDVNKRKNGFVWVPPNTAELWRLISFCLNMAN